MALASAAATGIRIYFAGWNPLFPMPAFRLTGVSELWLFALMGILMGLVGLCTIRTLDWLKDFFKLPSNYDRLVSGNRRAHPWRHRKFCSASLRHQLRHHPRKCSTITLASPASSALLRPISGRSSSHSAQAQPAASLRPPSLLAEDSVLPTPRPASISFRVSSATRLSILS